MRNRSLLFSIIIIPLLAISDSVNADQNGYPKIALMFATAQQELTLEKIARYDLIIDGGLFGSIGSYHIDYIRTLNPNLVNLYPLQTEYVNYQSPILSDPGFHEHYLVHYFKFHSPCDASNRYKQNWDFPIYSWNFMDDGAVQFRVNYIIRTFREMQQDNPNLYDGIHLDGTHLQPFFYMQHPDSLFDIDCDGDSDYFDSLEYIKPIWRQNVIQFLTLLRNSLPDIVIVCNDAKYYSDDINILAPLINGVESELDISFFMDDLYHTDWYNDIFIPMNHWTDQSLEPNVFLSISLHSSFPIFNPTIEQITAGRQDYQRMRFGFVTALMTNTYYLYDLSTNYIGKSLYWYDEYDNAGTQEPGYLGQPLNDAYCIDSLITPNILFNGSFEDGLTYWTEEDHDGTGSLQVDNSTSVEGRQSIKASLSSVPNFNYYFQLKQTGFQIYADSIYTLSFWAKSASPRAISILVLKDTSPWTGYCDEYSFQLTTDWEYYSYTFKVPATVNPIPSDTRFTFNLGADLPTVWIDDVQLKAGWSGTFRRDFENGIALCNIIDQQKIIHLDGDFYRINGTLDPIVNNGQPCSEISLNAKDGIILLKNKTPDQPDIHVSPNSLIAVNNDTLLLTIVNNGKANLDYSVSIKNLIKNHSFENGLNYWEEEDHLAFGLIQCDNSTSVDGFSSAKASLLSVPDYLYQFQLRQTGFQISADSLYTLSFWAKAEAPRSISIDVLKHSSPWTCYRHGYFNAYLTTDWQYCSNTFEVIHDVNPLPDDTRFTFYLGAASQTVWIDNVKLHPGSTAPDWLFFTPTAGSIPEGNNESIVLRTDISNLDEGTYRIEIVIESNDPDEHSISIPFRLTVITTGCDDDMHTSVAPSYELNQNYPNPFNPVTTITYSISGSDRVSLCVYNIQGQLVKTLVDEEKEAGYHTIAWDGRDKNDNDVSSGIYVYRLMTENGHTMTRRMVLIR